MKILIEINPDTHEAIKNWARERKIPVGNVYSAALSDAWSTGLIQTLEALQPRKERSDKGLVRGPRKKSEA